MDRDDVAMEISCIYSSSLVDRDTIDEIVSIKIYHRKDMDDIIACIWFCFSKTYFETKFNVKGRGYY
jgi:hypothetical protein